MKYKGYIVTAFLLALSACNKEDYHYPDVITDLVELETDSSSNIHLIRTENYRIQGFYSRFLIPCTLYLSANQ